MGCQKGLLILVKQKNKFLTTLTTLLSSLLKTVPLKVAFGFMTETHCGRGGDVDMSYTQLRKVCLAQQQLIAQE
jgi:hypothetical protein